MSSVMLTETSFVAAEEEHIPTYEPVTLEPSELTPQ